MPCIKSLFSLIAFMALTVVPSGASEWEIKNVLNLNWPGELVYFESKGRGGRDATGIEIAGKVTPVQIEEIGDGCVRYWSYVQVPKRKKEEVPFVARLVHDRVEPGITLARDGDSYLVDNGTYQFRLRYSGGELDEPIPLSELPHWIGGMRTLEQAEWDGRAWYDGNGKVTYAKTELLASGPVFIDFRIVLKFEGEEASGTVSAIPLANGKQSHLWAPNQFPSEEIPKYEQYYEARVRFVMNDSWIDVNERFHFPRDPSNGPWGLTQYWLQWGNPEGAPAVKGFGADEHTSLDTVTWVRWFLYGQFGGNSAQKYVPLEPRKDQKGKPFALLRPRWNQGGGGAQDFVVTSGGPPPLRDLGRLRSKYLKKATKDFVKKANDQQKAEFKSIDAVFRDKNKSFDERLAAGVKIGKLVGKEIPMPAENFSLENPAMGLVAAYASKWVGPYPATIAAYADANHRGRARFPMLDGERSGKHYGQRAYGLLVGKRRDFTNLNSVVRRHTDWTLNAEINKYILDWDRGGEVVWGGTLPKADLFIGRRYQDDFLNPTSRATRDLVQLGQVRREVGAGVPIGGPWNAALGYIFSDPDHWPGWHNGWTPGNPNFHTDKYMGAVYAGSAFPEHPHALEWLEYGWQNLEQDLDKAIIGNDGVGAECPGYAGYAMAHQLDVMRTLRDSGLEGVLEKGAKVKDSGTWHRKLITPYDYRLNLRHQAPIGDTHRWTSGLSGGFGKLAYLYQADDQDFAGEMLGTYYFLKSAGHDNKYMNLEEWLSGSELNVSPKDPKSMDWSSDVFDGFGAILRDGFGTDEETFLTFKAGKAFGHYHNDDMSYHFYSDGHPISLDYNCSYTPRGDHAGLHNSMTFGGEGRVLHNGRKKHVQAMEQIGSRSKVLAFETTPSIDRVVAERSSSGLVMSPLYPEDHEFQRKYPSRRLDTPITHRRTLLLVKSESSEASDYLVVHDETVSSEPQQLNVHLLARSLEISDHEVAATGQWDRDMTVAFFADDGAGEVKIEERAWYYSDIWMKTPGDAYTIRAGESLEEWDARVAQLASVPAADWEESYCSGKDDTGGEPWQKLIRETEGKALIPPVGWSKDKPWRYGEYQKWLRVHTDGGQGIVWVLYPHASGESPQIRYDAEKRTLIVEHGGGTDSFVITDGVSAEIDGQSIQLPEVP